MLTWRRRGEDQGSAAVEFVLVLPVLLIILFGIIDFGRLLHAKLQLAEAAREGGPAAALLRPARTPRTQWTPSSAA